MEPLVDYDGYEGWGADATTLFELLHAPTADAPPAVAPSAGVRKPINEDDDTSSDASKNSTAQQRYRKRQKRELDYLREQVAEMSAHLSVLKSIRSMETDQSSFWEKKARVQKLSSQKAAQENTRLKEAVEEQLKIAETLDQLLVKRPKLAAFPTMDMVEWKMRRMPLDDAGRHACFHALMADVYDRAFKVSANTAEDAILIDVQAVSLIPSHFMDAGMHIWSIWCDPNHSALKGIFESKTLETFGDDTSYLEQIESLRGGRPYLRRLAAMKRFVEDDRIVFVMNTVLHDPKHPPVDGLYSGNDVVTLVLERVSDTESRRRLCLHGQLPIAPPPGSPLVSNPRDLICDFILHEVTHTFDVLDQVMQ
ncbi:hypothetical protein SPRG_05991 [Saprolegnia parasitica CBS 223.65]|uniref:BZIP domain-containing protein n=1 Tax=Saprolegnia parasitica (strain CBS 223.65) TaxID=695850 RepID=A0A067CG14_SAPPC|nr:hypothetical protein SPRG_05991 [Saprolegnia parasitica CBS 223.65]KDO29453.1 hypothetical protein SPRG_05991 [Saprolegnia parasitica CBS 223.65]|eukprot:XP_012199952.1 hypothetical protein SPRG_05991 [Saprolegnia parasitica CBS 223.65]